MHGPVNRRQLIDGLKINMRASSMETIMLHQVVADLLGLNIADHKCLELMSRLGPTTAGKLAEYTGLTTGAITGVIDRLEEADFVRRHADPEDRRSVIIELVDSKRNKRMFENIFFPLSERMDALASTYGNEEIAVISEFISKVVRVLHEETMRISSSRGRARKPKAT